MAKRRRYLRGAIEHKLQLGTLAGKTPIKTDIVDVLTDTAWLSSVKAVWSMDNFTQAAGDGPIIVGICHSDYTVAEVEAWIENTGSWETGNIVQSQEVAKRKIRIVGIFPREPIAASAWTVLNDGRPVRTKCGWLLAEGQTLGVWAYNQGAGALGTTDPAVRALGHANLWPK